VVFRTSWKESSDLPLFFQLSRATTSTLFVSFCVIVIFKKQNKTTTTYLAERRFSDICVWSRPLLIILIYFWQVFICVLMNEIICCDELNGYEQFEG